MTPIRHCDYRVTSGHACAWVRVKSGVIVDAAPIYRWRWIGRPWEDMRKMADEVIDITDEEHAGDRPAEEE